MKTALLRFGETNLYGIFKANDGKKAMRRNNELKMLKAYNIDIVDELKSSMKKHKLEKHWYLVDERILSKILAIYEGFEEEVKK